MDLARRRGGFIYLFVALLGLVAVYPLSETGAIMYLDVDPGLVHEAVRDHLHVFQQFAQRVLAELESS